jgi:hypothetical protein
MRHLSAEEVPTSPISRGNHITIIILRTHPLPALDYATSHCTGATVFGHTTYQELLRSGHMYGRMAGETNVRPSFFCVCWYAGVCRRVISKGHLRRRNLAG